MKYYYKVAKTIGDKNVLARSAGFKNYAELVEKTEGAPAHTVIAGDGTTNWMIDMNSEFLLHEEKLGTYGKVELGYIHGGPNGNTYYATELDCWNTGDDDGADYVLVDEVSKL